MSAVLSIGHKRLGNGAALVAVILMILTGCGGQAFSVDVASVEAAASTPEPAQAAVSLRPASAPHPVGLAASGSAPHFVIRQQPRSVEVHEGEVAQFQVEAEGLRSITYQWQLDGEPINGATGSILQLSATAEDHLAKISVLVGSGADAVQSERVVLRVRRA